MQPQNDDKEHRCDFPGCNKPGEYRAPKNRGLKEYYWFCLEHVQAYNAKWNYYEGEDDEEAAAAAEEEKKKARQRMHFNGFRSKINYSFGRRLRDEFGFSATSAATCRRQRKYFLPNRNAVI